MKKIWTIVAAMAATLCATAQNSENGHEWVDLGLPSGLKWATMNVGATTPEGYGNAYAWGETEPKTKYDFTTYKYGDGTTFSKYNSTDGKEVLDLEDDAARVNWGGSWRMPTATDFEELLNNCTWTYNESLDGYMVYGSNGNTIFLPKTNFYYGTNPLLMTGYYRTSSLSDESFSLSKYFVFWNPEWGQTNGIDDIQRGHGMAVRPVCIPTKWYAVEVKTDLEGGSVAADSLKAKEGDLVTLTIAPASGYELAKIEVKDADNQAVALDGNKFTMPASTVSVSAKFVKTNYTVTVAEIENGTVEADHKTAQIGDEITLTIAPATGYELAKIEVKDADNQAVALDGNKFTMPASTVSVSAEFVKTNYTVTVAEIENGTVEADHKTAQIGDEITLTIAPAIGYELSKIEVKDADNQAVALDGNKFTMPASAVTVSAEFVKTNYDVIVAEIENGTVEANHQIAQLGDEITLTIAPATGYELAKIEVKDADNQAVELNGDKFTMPASAVKVSAEFVKTNYTVTVAEIENGTVEANHQTAQLGDEITLTIKAATGYELAKIEVKDADNQAVELNGDKFTMPASAVTVSAVFKRQTPTSLQSAETVAIYTENGRIVCEQEFRIYDLFGHDVTRMSGSLNGVYIVKVGDKAQKVIVSRK